MNFYIDGQTAVIFQVSQMATFYLPPGKHILGAGPNGDGFMCIGEESMRREIEVDLKVRDIKKYRLAITPDAQYSVNPTAF